MTTIRRPVGRSRIVFVAAAIVAALTLQLLGAQPAVSQSSVLTAYPSTADTALDPGSPVWGGAPAVNVPMTAQVVAWPFGGGSIKAVEVRALHSADTIFIRMSWSDRTRDNRAVAVDQFVDAAAVEFPARAASSVPSICMGQADGGVNIWQWQAGNGGGRAESIEELSGQGYVDRYPSTDRLYFPARAAGNPVSEATPVSDLVAIGFGTLDHAREQQVTGMAEWAYSRWSVVFTRQLSTGSAEQVDLGPGMTTDIAFAVWDGNANERNGTKSVSQFVQLDISSSKPPVDRGVPLAILFGSATLLGGFLLMELANGRAASTVDDRHPR